LYNIGFYYKFLFYNYNLVGTLLRL